MILQIAVNINTAKCSKNAFSVCAKLYFYGEVIIMYRRIRDLREDHDLTQREVAEMLHCSQQVYSNYELGQRDIPTNILIQLARYYNVSADYILDIDNTD